MAQTFNWVRPAGMPRRLELAVGYTNRRYPPTLLYRPFRRRARVAARLGWAATRWRRGQPDSPPLPQWHGLLRELGVAGDGVIAMRSSTPGRRVLGVVRDGQLAAVLKVGHPDDSGLQTEATALTRLAANVDGFRVPECLWSGDWLGHRVVAVAPLPSNARAEPNLEEIERVCAALAKVPVVHGDLAPWNVAMAGGCAHLIDWEHSRTTFAPLFDLAHYVVQTGHLLGRHDPATAVSLLVGRHSPGERYLEVIGVSPFTATEHLAAYLDATLVASGGAGRRYRRRMLDVLRGRRP